MNPQSITPEQAISLAGLFRERVNRTPDAVAYQQFDPAQGDWVECSWKDIATEVGRWQWALQREGLQPGDRVAMMLRNCREWIIFDQAALGLGLVTVPLYNDDRPDNIAYILNDAEVKLLLVEGKAQWKSLYPVREQLRSVKTVVTLNAIEGSSDLTDPRLHASPAWLFGLEGDLMTRVIEPDALATIVYTSGTTGRSKGVMLSHRSILTNAYAASQCAPLGSHDTFLSFLPLSHTLERTAGYVLPMLLGARVAFSRSVAQLGSDLTTIKPSILVSVPRIYESVYAKIQVSLKSKSVLARSLFNATVSAGWARFEYQQGRARWSPWLLAWPLLDRIVARKVLERLGGRLTFAICGGAPLPPPIARFFIGLGLPVYHGYGLTEASPVVSVNRPEANIPASIGKPLPGIEVSLGPDNELLTRSACVMQGYWNNPEATAAVLDAEGWLHTGDKARIDAQGFIFITGRIKDIIVLGNGEKLPPADMEMAIEMDALFDQVLVVGEGRPFLSLLAVINDQAWREYAQELNVDPDDDTALSSRFVERSLLSRVQKQLKDFPGYARIRRLTPLRQPWTVDSGLLTPTLKMKRLYILKTFERQIEAMYADYTDV